MKKQGILLEGAEYVQVKIYGMTLQCTDAIVAELYFLTSQSNVYVTHVARISILGKRMCAVPSFVLSLASGLGLTLKTLFY